VLYAVVARVKDGRIMVTCGNVVGPRNALLVQTDSGDDNEDADTIIGYLNEVVYATPEPDEHLKARKNL
jgi:hypothetical protein